jgi:multimeric flavodoxin WrbA
MSAVAINCTLKTDPHEESSTNLMIRVVADALAEQCVGFSETLRLSRFNILLGVTSDEGEGDDWPYIRRRILAADILIFGTPIWLGQMSSIAKRVLERMDAFLSETDEHGRMPSFSKLAVAAIVSNEDGADNVTADLFQALNDEGWTIPSGGACYWVGEAMHKTDLKDLNQIPDEVTQTAKMLASNAAHLARLLKDRPYPGKSQEQSRQKQQ